MNTQPVPSAGLAPVRLPDPVRWKYHAIGNYALNGVKPPRHLWS